MVQWLAGPEEDCDELDAPVSASAKKVRLEPPLATHAETQTSPLLLPFLQHFAKLKRLSLGSLKSGGGSTTVSLTLT